MKTIGVDVSKDKLDCALLREEDKYPTDYFMPITLTEQIAQAILQAV